MLSIGIASTGVLTLRLLRDREPPAAGPSGAAVLAPRRAVVGDVRDHQRHLPADRAAALAHDRRPRRARHRGAADARADHDPGRLRARVPRRRAAAARRARPPRLPLGHALLGLRRRRSSPTPRATSRAAGSPGTGTSRSTAASSSWSRPRGSRSRSPPRSASRHGQSAIALGIAAAPFVSLVVVPAAFATPRAARRRPRGAPPATDAALEGPAAEGIEEAVSDLSIRRGGGFAIVGLGHPARRADAAERRRADGRRDQPRAGAGSCPASSSTCC